MKYCVYWYTSDYLQDLEIICQNQSKIGTKYSCWLLKYRFSHVIYRMA